MSANGMIVINPPWKLKGKMSQILPKLVAQLGNQDAFYKCDTLVEE